MPEPAPIAFATVPDRYRHWRLDVEPPIATVKLAVDPQGGLGDGYELKLNSYDLAVDIELNDIVQRLRFEHPEIHAVVLTGEPEKVFCAGANIQMLAGATHHHKVNFCKFTNETRNAIEDASAHSGQVWLCAINGTAAGGGYELALACDEIVLVDDRASSVSLPEVPVLGVLPGTGGLTRLVDKRRVRRDVADVFATRAEGVLAREALAWGLVDSTERRSAFAGHVRDRALARAAASDRPSIGPGIPFPPVLRHVDGDAVRYQQVDVAIDRALGAATITVDGPAGEQPETEGQILAAGPAWWPLAACRQLDDALLHLRFNEPEIGTWVLRSRGDRMATLAAGDVISEHRHNWFVREVVLYWTRTLKRLDLSARTLVALVEPGSCFAGTLAELVLAADRSFVLDGTFAGSDLPAPAIVLDGANDGRHPMSNGLTRLQSRFWGHDDALEAVRSRFGKEVMAVEAAGLGLVTSAPDEIDWADEVRLTLEERAAFSPDALTGLEANLRFVGPETMESKIFGRLSAWQNWIFQRPSASGPNGALRTYGTGARPSFDRKRV